MAQQIFAQWDRILAALAADGQVALVSALTACRIRDGEGEEVVLEAPDHPDCECLFRHSPDHEARIQSVVRDLCQRDLRVRIAGEAGTITRGRYRHAQQHPLVQQIQQLFDAEILAFEPMSEEDWERHLARLRGEPPPSGS